MTQRAQLIWHSGLLLLLLVVCAALKSGLVVEYGWGTDGQYYLHLAQHVRDGDGLVSRVSLYHQGFLTWPHRVNQAPLWPVTLGLVGRVAALDWAARRLPEALFLLDLVLVYFVGNRMWRRLAGPGREPLAASGAITFGHVAVLLFAFNPVLFRFTSAPYSEALGFGLLFGALLAVDRAQEHSRVGWALAAGALSAAAMLARGQMLALPIAVVAALALAGLQRERGWRLPACALAGFALVMAPWVAYLASWVPALTPTVVLGMATQPETPGLPTYAFWVPTESWAGYLQDRLNGFIIAFTPGHRWSYFHSHGPAVALVPIAVVFAFIALARSRERLASWFAPERAIVWAAVLAGLGMLAPIHHAHSKLLFDWLFAHRHGLPFVLLILPAAAVLLATRRRWLTGGVLACALLGAVIGGADIVRGVRLSPITDWDRVLARWLDEHEQPPTVISTAPSALALLTSRANFHWMACDEPPAALERLLNGAGADYVVVYPWEESCAFLADARTQLAPVRDFGGGKIVVLRARHGSAPLIR